MRRTIRPLRNLLFALLICTFSIPLFAAEISEDPIYKTLGADLSELRDDFNAADGTVRLVFIVGPT